MNTPVLERAKKNWSKLGAGVYAGILSIVVLAVSGVAGLLFHLPCMPWDCRASRPRPCAA
jgi:hypothetical protein